MQAVLGAQYLDSPCHPSPTHTLPPHPPPPPPHPQVFLGAQYVNSPTLSDVRFMVEGRPFHGHRIALLAASDIFRSMFDGHYREKEASEIPIPNIRWEVFERMMVCCYTGERRGWGMRMCGRCLSA